MSETTHAPSEQEVEAEKALYRDSEVKTLANDSEAVNKALDERDLTAFHYEDSTGSYERSKGLTPESVRSLRDNIEDISTSVEELARQQGEALGLNKQDRHALGDMIFRTKLREAAFPAGHEFTERDDDVAKHALELASMSEDAFDGYVAEWEKHDKEKAHLEKAKLADQYNKAHDEAFLEHDDRDKQRRKDLVDDYANYQEKYKSWSTPEVKAQREQERLDRAAVVFAEDEAEAKRVAAAEGNDITPEVEAAPTKPPLDLFADREPKPSVVEGSNGVSPDGKFMRRSSAEAGTINWMDIKVDKDGNVHADQFLQGSDGVVYTPNRVTYKGEFAKKFLKDMEILKEENPTAEQLAELSPLVKQPPEQSAGSSPRERGPSGGGGGEAAPTTPEKKNGKRGKGVLGTAATVLALVGSLGGLFGASAAPQSHQAHGNPTAAASAPNTHRG